MLSANGQCHDSEPERANVGDARASLPGFDGGRYAEIHRKLHRVLLAEDDEDTRHMVATALRQDGYLVIEAKNGAELLDYVGASLLFQDGVPPPDIIISDIRMPGFTGTGVLAGLRDNGCDTPFVLITGFGSEETREEARRIGADAVFHKPFDIDDLRTIVQNLLPRRTPPGGLPRGSEGPR